MSYKSRPFGNGDKLTINAASGLIQKVIHQATLGKSLEDLLAIREVLAIGISKIDTILANRRSK